MRTNKQYVLLVPCSRQIRFTVSDIPQLKCAQATEAVNQTSYPVKEFILNLTKRFHYRQKMPWDHSIMLGFTR